MEIVTVEPFHQPEVVSGIVSVYQRTFGGEPWNEGYRCPMCEKVFPLAVETTRIHSIQVCPDCLIQGNRIILAEYWPTSKVLHDFYQEMRRAESLCLIAKNGAEIVGIAWGYRIVIDSETEGHLDAPGLQGIVSGDFFYLDEVAVLPEYQGRGIGKKLVQQIFQEQLHKNILLRTLGQSQMFCLTRSMGGEVVLNISRDRVIMTLTV